jgi:hypothetical protein
MFTPNAFRNLLARARLLKGAFGVHPCASVAGIKHFRSLLGR